MPWNWQKPDWPYFRWSEAALAGLEARFLRSAGEHIGSIKHVGEADRTTILIDLMTGEALKTSEIEGELLNRDSVQSSLRRQFGLETDQRRVPRAEAGIAEMMVDLYRGFAEPVTHESMHRWHRMILGGRWDIERTGAYRTHATPMQVVSGHPYKPKVHFEAPPSDAVQREMDRFVAWFADTAPEGAHPLPALTRAGLAHLHFVSVHPYEDGNGRIARALAERALAQALGQPILIALSPVIERKRAVYYEALEANNKGMEVGGWLVHFAETVLSAQAKTQALIDFLIAKTRLYDRVRDQLNARQARAVARMFREGPEGFGGGLSAANYISITGASRATATRDLADLVNKAVLNVSGALKSTRYALNLGDASERQASERPTRTRSPGANRNSEDAVASAILKVSRGLVPGKSGSMPVPKRREGGSMPVATIDEIRQRVGSEVGVSDWILVDQARIDAFADVTEDHQFIHVDPERAAKTPFGGTIAHGFLSLSLLSRMAADVMLRPETVRMAVNYGFEKVRFIVPVHNGRRVRGRFRLERFEERSPGQYQFVHQVTVEIEGEDKPALIADWIGMIFT